MKNTKDTNMDEDKIILISVFSTNNNALFQVAKSLLKNYGIKFWSSGKYMSFNLFGGVYNSEIKVFKRDEKTAKKLLSELTPSQYYPSNKFDKKIQSFIGHWGIGIILVIHYTNNNYFILS